MSPPPTSEKLLNIISKIDSAYFPNERDRTTALAAARSLCHRLERPMDNMMRVAWIEPCYAACLKIALDAGVFRALGPGKAYSVKQLAETTGAEEGLLGM